MTDDGERQLDATFGPGSSKNLLNMKEAEAQALGLLTPKEAEIVLQYDDALTAEKQARRDAAGGVLSDEDFEAARMAVQARIPESKTVMPKFVALADKVFENQPK